MSVAASGSEAASARQDSGAGGGFENALGRFTGNPRCEVGGIRRKDQRPEIEVIEGQDRAGENSVGSSHDLPLQHAGTRNPTIWIRE